MELNNYNKFINFYTEFIKGTGYLAFRDLPTILNDFIDCKDKLTLDFGCGAGRSSRYLKELGLNIIGVDINENLLNTARNNNPDINFYSIQDRMIPFEEDLFDIIFNSFVLFDMSSKEEMLYHFKEMRRVCKKNGLVISITNSNYLFNKNWLTVKNNFPENKNLESGKIAKIFLSDVNIELLDFYWTEEDYIECFNLAGLKPIKIYHPVGKNTDPYIWLDEKIFPPYAIFICQK